MWALGIAGCLTILRTALADAAYASQPHTKIDYVPPESAGGSMLTKWLKKEDPPPGEPLNVIISAQSDPRVLMHRLNDGGLYNYFEAIGFSGQCFGLGMGDKQYADLGDGLGDQPQEGVLRWMFFRDPFLGTCLESIFGGNHFRVFRQDSTGAVFLAASAEEDAQGHHDLDMNAYDIGRNHIVGSATNTIIPDIPAGYSTEGEISHRGITYHTSAEFRPGLMSINRTHWNHFDDTAYVGYDVSDGLVAVMTVHVV